MQCASASASMRRASTASCGTKRSAAWSKCRRARPGRRSPRAYAQGMPRPQPRACAPPCPPSARASRQTAPAPTAGRQSCTWTRITLITPEGELRQINRLSHRELFSLVVGGQGLFGTIYSVNLRIDSLARAVNEAAGGRSAGCCSRRCAAAAPAGSARGARALRRRRAGALRRLARCGAGHRGAPACCRRRKRFLRWARREYTEVGLRFAALQTIGGAVRDTPAAPRADRRRDRRRRQLSHRAHARRHARAGRRLLPRATRVPGREAPHRPGREAGEQLVPAPPQPVQPGGLRGALQAQA